MYCRLLASNVYFGYEGAYFSWGSACLKQLEIVLSHHFMIGHNAAGLREEWYEWHQLTKHKTSAAHYVWDPVWKYQLARHICWTGWPSYNFTGHEPALKSTPVLFNAGPPVWRWPSVETTCTTRPHVTRSRRTVNCSPVGTWIDVRLLP